MKALNLGTRLPPSEQPARTSLGHTAAVGCACVLLAFAPRPALAIDGIALAIGQDDDANASVKLVRVGAQWTWKKRWFENGNWHLGGYWDLQFGTWDNDSRNATNSGLWDAAITPMFRVQQNTRSTFAPYGEIGVGVHLLSNTSVSAQRKFSTAFQFGSQAGVGARFGPKNAFDLGYRFQHLSNAGIKEPNNGINFHILRLGYWF